MYELTQTLLEIRKKERARLSQTTFNLTEAQHSALKKISDETKMPISALLREAVEHVIEIRNKR